MDMLSGARLVSIGETHDNLNDQRVELTVVRELHRRFPGKVAIGMEMFREPQQGVLDRWVAGELTELEFLKASKWYETWRYDFGAYRDLLLFARENRIDVIALNPPKELQDAVRRTGLDNVPEDLRRKLPEIGETDPWQRAVLRGVFGGHAGHGGGDGSFGSFLRVQLLWEETMAQKVVDYLKSPRGEGKTDGDDHRRLAREIRLRAPEEGGPPHADGVRDRPPRGDQHAGAEGGAADGARCPRSRCSRPISSGMSRTTTSRRSGSAWGSGWRRRRGVSSSNRSRRDPRRRKPGSRRETSSSRSTGNR